MEVCTINFSSVHKHSMPFLHNHDYFEMYFQLSGTRQYFYKNKYYTLSDNTLVVTPPNLLHKYEGGPYERILIKIPVETLSPYQVIFLKNLGKKIALQFLIEDMEKIRQTLDELLAIQSNILTDHSVEFSLTLGTLFQQIYKANTKRINASITLPKNQLNKQVAAIILKVMDYVQLYYNKPISYKQLCSVFNLSKTSLYDNFMKVNGITIFEYKLILQLNEAKKLLQETNYSIERISKIVGFSSGNYFIKVFKKECYSTPLNYRKSNKQNNNEQKRKNK